jgi:ABC-type phosphate transport system permease subunit
MVHGTSNQSLNAQKLSSALVTCSCSCSFYLFFFFSFGVLDNGVPGFLGDAANELCRKDKWSPANDMMRWSKNSKGSSVSAVYDARGVKISGGCPGMNPWWVSPWCCPLDS